MDADSNRRLQDEQEWIRVEMRNYEIMITDEIIVLAVSILCPPIEDLAIAVPTCPTGSVYTRRSPFPITVQE